MIIDINGKHNPKPPIANVEISGILPMYTRSITLYKTLISCATIIGPAKFVICLAIFP